MNKHKNSTFELCNQYLGENKIKRNLKVMATLLFTNNILSIVEKSLLSTSPTYAKVDT